MRGGICLDEEFIYPVIFKGTTSVDYQMATFVLSRENNVTMQELVAVVVSCCLWQRWEHLWDGASWTPAAAAETGEATAGRETYEVSQYTIWKRSICIIRNCIKTRNHLLKVAAAALSPSLSGGTTSHHSGGIEGGGGGGRWRRHGLGRNGGCGKQDVGCC